MKIIKLIGLVLFMACLTSFVGVLFVGQYQFDYSKLSENPTEAEEYFYQNLLRLGTHAKDKFRMVDDIQSSIAAANRAINNKYAINENLQNKVDSAALSLMDAPFTTSFYEDLPLSKVQLQKLREYTTWMAGKKYSAEDLQNYLKQAINNFNSGIINTFGLDSYKAKELTTNTLKQSVTGLVARHPSLLFTLIFVFGAATALLYILPNLVLLGGPGIKNNGIFHNPMTSRKWLGILTGSLLITFYIILYWFPYYLVEWILITEPFAHWLSGGTSSQWFVYGLLYTLAVGVMGVRMLIKYRHSNYHLIRTLSVIFFQLAFAFIIPQLLAKNSLPAIDLKNMWPLDYSFFFDYRIDQMIEAGTIGYFMLGWGIVLFVVAVPVFTYLYGKRWYCSWVCGCGGLAETFGDPYRQLSDKSLRAWKIERWSIHLVLVFAVGMTALVLYSYFSGNATVLGLNSYTVRGWYGFLIGSVFAGVVGTGFYPLMGNRMWCRFGCPLAAYMGIIQRFKSRFRITTNGGQCISCGNCSTYCEQGIDVRSYAQKGENIVRASCVGCGVCAAVCPRGVLKLENGPEAGRIHGPIEISEKGIQVF
ncbi:4Fe-4S binding protein [bacterium]|nr:4Fe-4S binding protein [bacterium]